MHRLRLKQALVCGGTALLALVFGASTSDWSFELGFYETIAQVIPVLLLAVAVEGRYFNERPTRPPFDRFMVQWFLFTPLVAEGSALAVIARGDDVDVLRGMVLSGVLVSVALFLVLASEGPLSASRNERTT